MWLAVQESGQKEGMGLAGLQQALSLLLLIYSFGIWMP
jgi:hypothetical protein